MKTLDALGHLEGSCHKISLQPMMDLFTVIFKHTHGLEGIVYFTLKLLLTSQYSSELEFLDFEKTVM